ncbi:MAG: methyltransferase [Phycisphaerae bacterium SM23_33]|nr:MAG: methyltransferase [Phycisphaerae bacterium SM23_33]
MALTDIESLNRDIVFNARLRGHDLTFHSTWGLFSPRRIDDGSRMLTEKVELQVDQVTLDLGCGYGAIGVAIAKDCPLGKVHMVDKDFVAVEYARENAALNRLGNCEIYLSNAFSKVPDIRFDNIVSNIPANVGAEMLAIILHGAKAHLAAGGRLYVVTVAGLRQYIKRNFMEVFGNYRKLKQGKTYTVALAVKHQASRQS